jgi:CubicO group peptidase (beta-lactamase class C family)
MQESEVEDYLLNFPSRTLNAAGSPFIFEVSRDEERVAKVFEEILEANDFTTFLEAEFTQAFIVIQDDSILFESYLNGTERGSLLTSFSVAKSYTSALIGIAIDEGHIGSVDDPITVYLPELLNRDERFRDITVRDLLLMASGMDYVEMRPGIFNGDDPITTYYLDQREAALEFTTIIDPPHEYFQYNKYHPQMLGMILERTTGQSVTKYTQEKLWDPLGMEYAGSWSLDSEKSGFEKMEAGLQARAIDFAKLGRLYLNGGNLGGTQVISEDWITASTAPDPSTENDNYYSTDFGNALYRTLNGYYKYMWYGYHREGGLPDFAAEGDHGQYIYVSPEANLIIVRNGFEYGETMTWDSWVRLFYEFATEF